MRKVLAFDFGASSGRCILGTYQAGVLSLEQIHRFSNYPIQEAGKRYWDIDYLLEQVLQSIQKAQAHHTIDSLGIATWGVDFGMIDHQGELLEKPRSYRDPIPKKIVEAVAEVHPLPLLYAKTGNQIMPINTLFQLYRTKLESPTLLENTASILWMPDLLNYLLTGVICAERSIASTSQLLNPQTLDWEREILDMLGLPTHILPPLVDAPQVVGQVKKKFGVGDLPVINICEHDTASAVVSIPNPAEFLFISCGTWALVGTELPEPILTLEAYQSNITNELGFDQTTRFLKNLTGLWLIQELRRELEEQGQEYSFAALIRDAAAAPAFKCVIHPDDALFSSPGPMQERIDFYAQWTNQTPPQKVGEYARCIYESLALQFHQTFMDIEGMTSKIFSKVNLVGGGSQATLLCQMIADASQKTVVAGPAEATAIGNIAVQLLALEEFSTLADVRTWLEASSNTVSYIPDESAKEWQSQFMTYQRMVAAMREHDLAEIYSEYQRAKMT